jgi:hypothetical protein
VVTPSILPIEHDDTARNSAHDGGIRIRQHQDSHGCSVCMRVIETAQFV